MERMSENKVLNKTIELSISNEIKESYKYIKLVKSSISFKNELKNNLLKEKPSRFNKKELNEWKEKINKLDDEINRCYLSIEKELNIIDKLLN